MMTFPKAHTVDPQRLTQLKKGEQLSLGTSVLIWCGLSVISWAVFIFGALQLV